MSFDRENALEVLDESITTFDELEKKIRIDGISEYVKDEYNEIYEQTIKAISQFFSEQEALNFSQSSSVPGYDLDYEEENEVYQQSIVECIRMLEDYRQKI